MDELEHELQRAELAISTRRAAAKEFEEELLLSDEVTKSPATRGLFADVGASAVRGVVRGVKASYDAVERVAEAIVGVTGDIRLNIGNGRPLVEVQSPAEARAANLGDDAVNRALGSASDAIGEPQSTVGSLTEGFTQFITGFLGAKKFLKGWDVLQKGGKAVLAARSTIEGAIASGIAFEGDERNLANLIEDAKPFGLDLSNPVTEFLAVEGDDSELAGRLKNTLTDAVGGVVAEGFIHSLRALRAARKAKAEGGEEALALDDASTPEPNIDISLGREPDPPQAPELTLTDEPLVPAPREPDPASLVAIKARADLLKLEGEEELAKAADELEGASDVLTQQAKRATDAINKSKPVPFRELSPDERFDVVRQELGITEEKLEEIRSLVREGKIEPEEVHRLIGINASRVVFDGVDDPESMVGLLNAFARVFEEAGVKAGSAPQTLKSIAAHADSIGGSVDEAVKLWERTRNLPAYVWAQRIAVHGSAAKLHRLAKTIASGKFSPQDLLEFVTHDRRHAMLQVVARGTRAEIGRALRVMREGVAVNEAALKLANGRRMRQARKAREAAAAAKSASGKVQQLARVKKTASDAKAKAEEAEKKVLSMEEAVEAAREALAKAHDARMKSEAKAAKKAHKAALKAAQKEAKAARKAAEKAEAEAKRFEDAANADFDKVRGADVVLEGDTALQFGEVEEALRGMGLRPDDVVDLAKQVAARENTVGVNQAARTGLWHRFVDRITSLYINNILSGLPTMVINVSSGFYKMIESVAERYGAALMRGGRYELIAAHKAAIATFSTWRAAWIAAGKAWAEGLPQTDIMSRAEVALRGGTGVSLPEKVLSAPSRAILTIDEFFKHIFYQQELTQRAVEVAAAAARVQPEANAERTFRAVLKETLENPPDDLVLDAIESARYNTFQSNLESALGKNLIRLTNETPITKLIVPFIKTPTNIIKQGLGERSPLALLSAKFWRTVRAGGREGRTAMFRMMMGTTAVGIAWQWADEGRITGSRVGRPGLPNTADLEGPPPYSIRIGNTWYQYNRLDPIGTVLGLTADIRRLWNERTERNSNAIESDDQETLAAFAALLGIVSENVTDKTFFKGIADFVQAMEAGASERGSVIESYVNSLGTNLVPFSSMQRNIARAHDEYAREAFSFTDKLMQQTPGLSTKLPPKRDILGRPIKHTDRVGADWASPFLVGKDDPDPAARALASIEMDYRMPDKDIAGVKLSAEQYSYLAEQRGQYIHRQLTEWISAGEWSELTKVQKQNKVRQWMTTATRTAERAVLEKWPDLGSLVEGRKQEVRALRSGDLE